MSATVLLINRNLAYNAVGNLIGASGVTYGSSFFESAFNAHVCRMTLEEWRACKKDVTQGSTRLWQQWEVDIELPESPAGGEEVVARIQSAALKQLEAIVSSLNPVAQAVFTRAQELQQPSAEAQPVKPFTFPVATSPVAPHEPQIGTADDPLVGLTYRALLSIAKKAGVANVDQIDSSEGLREAIRSVGGTPPEPAHEHGRMFDAPDPRPPAPPAFAGGKSA